MSVNIKEHQPTPTAELVSGGSKKKGRETPASKPEWVGGRGEVRFAVSTRCGGYQTWLPQALQILLCPSQLQLREPGVKDAESTSNLR